MSRFDCQIFPPEVLAARDRINRQLDLYTQFDQPTDSLAGAHCPRRLRDAIRYSLLSGGKRMRPLLVLAAANACGGEMDQAMPAACAVEMIHTYSLIHDDLPAMDDDDLRRGQPTCHVRFDQATAILAGDALLALAFEILARDIPSHRAGTCCQWLANAAGAMLLVGGQVDDLAALDNPLDLTTLQSIHRRKTGALITVSLKLGAWIAGADGERLRCFEVFGQEIGLTFQIVDDLLDLKGDQDTIGKRVGKDQAQGKLTYPALLGVTASERLAREKADAAIAALSPLGPAAEPLKWFAHFVVNRTH